ncbi:hypothetical protein CC78DRAFT_605102 [Lojkania enalia]|uniref:Uncharacterized protein n=1 Tax=Lojkania enalia TaxID=147567 RepID=A0A9P4K8H4_9PLEO|nr:hypothetical protein CC78DRAFT_605102 [Didymosphaeria enalia]
MGLLRQTDPTATPTLSRTPVAHSFNPRAAEFHPNQFNASKEGLETAPKESLVKLTPQTLSAFNGILDLFGNIEASVANDVSESSLLSNQDIELWVANMSVYNDYPIHSMVEENGRVDMAGISREFLPTVYGGRHDTPRRAPRANVKIAQPPMGYSNLGHADGFLPANLMSPDRATAVSADSDSSYLTASNATITPGMAIAPSYPNPPLFHPAPLSSAQNPLLANHLQPGQPGYVRPELYEMLPPHITKQMRQLQQMTECQGTYPTKRIQAHPQTPTQPFVQPVFQHATESKSNRRRHRPRDHPRRPFRAGKRLDQGPEPSAADIYPDDWANVSTLGNFDTPPRARAPSYAPNVPGVDLFQAKAKTTAQAPPKAQQLLSQDQLDGSKYGLKMWGLGMAKLGDKWEPPFHEAGPIFRTRPGDKNLSAIWCDDE